MKAIKRMFILAAASIILLVLSIYLFTYYTATISMKNNGGSTRLYSLSAGSVLRLDEGWACFKDRDLAESADLDPGIFSGGNYYWHIKLDTAKMRGQNALLVSPLYSAYRIWLNGDLLYECGTPSAEGEKPGRSKLSIVPFSQQSDSLDIVIQVSNENHYYGGSNHHWLYYGRFADIELYANQSRLLDYVVISLLYAFAIVHLLNYYFHRRLSHSFYFFLYLFVYAVYALFTGRLTVNYLYPGIEASLLYRLEAVFHLLGFPVLLGYIKSIYPEEVSPKIFGSVVFLAAAAAVSAVLVPFEVFTEIFIGFTALRVAAAVYIGICLLVAAVRKRYDSLLTLFFFMIMSLCMLNDMLYAFTLIESVRLGFTGLILFAAQQTYRLVKDNLAYFRFSEETLERLHNLTSQKEGFISRNSTELGKPIRNIVDLGESLLRGSIGNLNSEQTATASLIVSNGIRLSNMINDIIDFTSIKDQSLRLDRGPVDLYILSRRVLNSCESMVAIQEKELESDIERDVPRIEADEKRVEQILYNMVSNAVSHMQEGRVVLSTELSGDGVTIVVRISGSDLSPESVDELFSDYEHVRIVDSEDKSMGDLSLAIAKKLIELHDSSIAVDCSDDQLVYRFKLPLYSGGMIMSDEEQLEMDALINLQPVFDEVASDRDIEVLIAGKDVEELQIIKSQLASMNYTVIPEISGADLLSRVLQSKPNLVIADVKLPDMGGYELCSKIRETYSKDELPVILVINKEDASDMLEGLTSGANDFLTRPYIAEEFLTRVNTHLQLSRISTVYSRFVPTEFLRSLGQENIVDIELGDQVQREMTILFVDIRSFTTLSENMTPEENFKFINSYLSRFSPMITNNGGFVDKYIGDAIMALFPHKPEDALHAAAAMIEHVNVYNGHRANCGYRPINIGIGIHTGSMILGVIGDEARMQGTVISDAVNLAARIQDVTKLYKANIVISQETFVKLDNPMDYNFRFLGRVKVKGKDKAVALFEIFDSEDDIRRDNKNSTKPDFEEAIMKFSRREFDSARRLLGNVIESDPKDETARIFIDRIDKIRLTEKKNFLTSL